MFERGSVGLLCLSWVNLPAGINYLLPATYLPPAPHPTIKYRVTNIDTKQTQIIVFVITNMREKMEEIYISFAS